MLPKQDILRTFIKSNVSFILYGHKASGKSTLIYRCLKDTNTQYLQINCTLASKRANFLKLFNVSLIKYLKQKGANIELKQCGNIDSWLTDIKEIAQTHEQIVQLLDNMYIFIDNIEQLILNQFFLPSFYSACQKQFRFKFNFIFCGVNFSKKQYGLEIPFRTMISFCMPKPVQQYQNIIIKTLVQKMKAKFKQKQYQQQIQKGSIMLAKMIKQSYNTIQMSLQNIKNNTVYVFQGIQNTINQKQILKSIKRIINNGDLINHIRSLHERDFSCTTQYKRKIKQSPQQETYEAIPNLQYYPNLILSSIHLADYYNQKQDKRRFQDYKNKTYNKNKQIKKLDFKIGKHNVQRIISICQALESQAKDNQKQKKLQHHSLDFYSQFQHLSRISRLKITYEKCNGIVKQEEVKAFFSQNNLHYQQFMSS